MNTPEELAAAARSELRSAGVIAPPFALTDTVILKAIRAAVENERAQSCKAMEGIAKAYSYEQNCAPLINAELARLAIERNGEEPV